MSACIGQPNFDAGQTGLVCLDSEASDTHRRGILGNYPVGRAAPACSGHSDSKRRPTTLVPGSSTHKACQELAIGNQTFAGCNPGAMRVAKAASMLCHAARSCAVARRGSSLPPQCSRVFGPGLKGMRAALPNSKTSANIVDIGRRGMWPSEHQSTSSRQAIGA